MPKVIITFVKMIHRNSKIPPLNIKISRNLYENTVGNGNKLSDDRSHTKYKVQYTDPRI